MESTPSVFTKIINRQLPADILYETDELIVIRSIEPHAPIHILAIPKIAVPNIHMFLQDESHKDLLWNLHQALRSVAITLGIGESGYKLVTNYGEDAGQSVMHLHIHLLGGATLQED